MAAGFVIAGAALAGTELRKPYTLTGSFRNRSPEGRPGISDVPPPCLKSQGCQFDTTFYISSFVLLPIILLLFVSSPFLLWARSPDLFFPKPPFSERYNYKALLCGSCFVFCLSS